MRRAATAEWNTGVFKSHFLSTNIKLIIRRISLVRSGSVLYDDPPPVVQLAPEGFTAVNLHARRRYDLVRVLPYDVSQEAVSLH